MKRLQVGILGAVLAMGASSAAWAKAKGGASDVVSIGNSATVGVGETVGDLVVVGGSATVRGTVNGDAVVIGGTADVDGSVAGDVVAVGSARLGPKASVQGDAVVIGGSFEADPMAKIRGEKTVISTLSLMPRFGGLQGWISGGPLRARPLAPGVWWAWALGLMFGLLYILVAAGAPQAVEACAEAMRARPVGVFLAGVLGLAGLAPFAFLLAVSVVGIAVVPMLFLAAFAATIIGKAALCRLMGARAGLKSAVAATALGAAALLGLYAVPVLGFFSWVLSTVFGFGAAILAAVEALKGEAGPVEETKPAAAAPAEGSEAAALPRAGFWLRLAAVVIDGFAFLVIGAITHLLFLGLGGWALYQVGMWVWKGTTFGGMIVGIKGSRLDGRPMDVSVALVRHLASYLSALPMFLGFFWVGFDPEKQSWHDKIAGTIVVRVPKTQPLI